MRGQLSSLSSVIIRSATLLSNCAYSISLSSESSSSLSFPVSLRRSYIGSQRFLSLTSGKIRMIKVRCLPAGTDVYSSGNEQLETFAVLRSPQMTGRRASHIFNPDLINSLSNVPRTARISLIFNHRYSSTLSISRSQAPSKEPAAFTNPLQYPQN